MNVKNLSPLFFFLIFFIFKSLVSGDVFSFFWGKKDNKSASKKRWKKISGNNINFIGQPANAVHIRKLKKQTKKTKLIQQMIFLS